MIHLLKDYPDADAYRAHQIAKTSNPKLRERLGLRRKERIASFCRRFAEIVKHVPSGSDALCLGARYGEEVEALLQLGYKAIGVDLVPSPPLVVEADFHHLPFEDNSFDVIYSNSLDHALDLPQMMAEVCRVLRHPAWLLVRLCFRDQDFGTFETMRLDGAEDLMSLLPDFRIVSRPEEPGRTRLFLERTYDE